MEDTEQSQGEAIARPDAPADARDTTVDVPAGARTWRGYPVVLPNRRDPRLRLAAVTTSLHVLGQTTFNFNLSIAQILVSLLAAAVVEFSISFFRDHRIAWPASALLTGNSVALILRVPGTEHGEWWSTRGWWIFAATSALAVGSKYVIRWKGAHFFNPSNLMLVLAFVILGESRADPQILWWGPWSIGLALGFGVILGGSIAVTHHVRQLHTALAFWAPFAALMGVLAASGHAITTNWHVGPLAGWAYWVTLVLSPEVMVFAFFMITDPKASPVTDRGKVVFGFMIALLSAAFVATQTGEFGTKVGILAGLVVLCPAIPFINARTGAPAEPVPTGKPFIATPDGAPLVVRHAPADARPRITNASADASVGPSTPALLHSFTPGQVAIAALAMALVAAGVYAAGSHWSYDDPAGTDSTANLAALQLRDETILDASTLPVVELDDSAARSAFRLTPDLAERIAHDAVLDLLLEAQAVPERDQQLAAAATTAGRLAEVTDMIERLSRDTTVPPPLQVAYTFDALTVTLFKADDGPQTPPELAVRVVGTVSGALGGVDMDTWFTVTAVGGTYLITGAFDADRSPVVPSPVDPGLIGDAGLDPDSDTPITETTTPATEAELAGLQLVDRAAEMGLGLPHARYGLGEGQDFRIGGAAVGDIDGDGYADILLTRVGYPNVLYRNDAGRGFTDVTVEAGLSDVSTDTAIDGGSTAAAFVDLDGDGNIDLITLGATGTPNRVHLGDGAGRFTDATDRWGFLPIGPLPQNSLAVDLAVSDVDRDGRPDLLVVASEPDRITAALSDAGISDEAEDDAGRDVCGPDARAAIDGLESAPSGTRLLRNTGNGFTDITERLGVDPSLVAANSARFVDLSGDGRDELIIAGGSCTTKVLVDDGGRFVDRTTEMGFDRIPHATGVTTLDVDHDGQPDVFLTGISYASASGRCETGITGFACSPNHLMLNGGDGTFTDAAERFEVRHSAWSWGATAVDLNNDGFDELYVSNGMRSVERWWSNADPHDGVAYDWSTSTDRLWLGAADGPMRSTENASDAPPVIRSSDITRSRAVIAADFDLDGRMDLLVIDTASEPTLLMNDTENDNHWTAVELIDASYIGATVTFELDDRTITRRVGVDRSYQSGGRPVVHVGLGGSEAPRWVTVTRRDGTTLAIEAPPVDQWLRIGRDGLL